MRAFKCPHCGGDVKYDISKEHIKCEYCGSDITREDYQTYLDENNAYITNELTCPQCGGTLLSYDNTLTTFCSYCGSQVEFTKRTLVTRKPDKIIPFKIGKYSAIRAYQEKINKSFFAPQWLEEDGSNNITGIYMPYYVYKITADQQKCRSQGTSREEHVDYTLVSTYMMQFDLHAEYNGMRFDAVSALPDALGESVDSFNTKYQKPFESSYLAGFYADGGDVDGEEYDEIAKHLIANDIRGMRLSQNNVKFKTGNIQPEINIERETTLMPVWLNTHKKGDKLCYAAINGETEHVAADIPIDKGKYLITSVIIAAVLFLLFNLIFTFKPWAFLMLSLVLLGVFAFVLRNAAGDVWVKENSYDDIGLIGKKEFDSIASINKSTINSTEKSPGKSIWTFNVPTYVTFKAMLPLLIGVLISFAGLAFGTIHDNIFYLAGILNILLSIYSGFKIIEQQNILSTRDIPVFTMERGGKQ